MRRLKQIALFSTSLVLFAPLASAKQYRPPQDSAIPIAIVRVNVTNDSASEAWKRYFYVSVSNREDCAGNKDKGQTLTWVNLKKMAAFSGEPLKIEAEKEHILTFHYIDTKFGWVRDCHVTGVVKLGAGSEVTAEFNIDKWVTACDVSMSQRGSAALPGEQFEKLPVVCYTNETPVLSGEGHTYEPARVRVIITH